MHYRKLQWYYNGCLARGDWDETITLSCQAREEIAWWATECQFPLPASSIKDTSPSLTVHTDASQLGWGMSSSDGCTASGKWSHTEANLHINMLELLAVFKSICCLTNISGIHIHVITDNSSTMYYLNNMGGTHSYSMCRLAIKVWERCRENRNWLSATHIPGVMNVEADHFSWAKQMHDYSLSQKAFEDLLVLVGFKPEVDLFASRNTWKLTKFVTKSADLLAWHTDAFSFKWEDAVYMFPPLCLISATVQKFICDSVDEGLLITPYWLELPCVASLFKLLTCDPILIPAACLEGTRPTRYKFQLVAWHISCQPVKTQVFQNQRHKRCLKASVQRPSSPTLGSGKSLQLGWEKAGILLQSLYQ